MPLYEYYCRPCETTFEQLRPMSRSSKPAQCPAGHPGANRVVSLVAAPPREGSDAIAELTPGGGCGCAAGACACGRR